MAPRHENEKTGSTYSIATTFEEDRATVTGNMHNKLVKFGHVQVFELCEWTDKQTDRRTDRQTNKQTDILITILRTPLGGEVTNDDSIHATQSKDLKRPYASLT